jgi:hypothetical protein
MIASIRAIAKTKIDGHSSSISFGLLDAAIRITLWAGGVLIAACGRTETKMAQTANMINTNPATSIWLIRY